MLAAVSAAGCVVDAPLGADDRAAFRVVVDTPATLHDKVDLLFVIDNSENMAARQAELANSLNALFSELEFGRGMPDLHIAVVTTDMGIGSFASEETSCSQSGQNGQLKFAAQDCGVPDNFLTVKSDATGRLFTNMDETASTQSLAHTLGCMVQRGESGCEYEQPLEAMKQALSPQGRINSFVRSDAVLAIVLLTDEDDCSAYNPSLFDPGNPRFGSDSPNFRCFQTGIVCDGDDVYQPGQRDGCHPDANSEYIASIDSYVDFVASIKPDPKSRIVTAIIGDSVNIGVELDKREDAQLVPTCEDDRGAAVFPAIRLSAFVDSFDKRGQETSMCQVQEHAYVRKVTEQIRTSLGTTCLQGPISDVDPIKEAHQIDCFVYDQEADNRNTRRFFTACDKPGDLAHSSILPCYAIQTGGESCATQTQLTLQIFGRAQPPSQDTHTVAECRVDDLP